MQLHTRLAASVYDIEALSRDCFTVLSQLNTTNCRHKVYLVDASSRGGNTGLLRNTSVYNYR